jgi:hypothetical protein
MLTHLERLRYVALVGAVLMTAGRAVDLRWHAIHDEFETGADQVQAHWLAWLGALVLLAVGLAGMRRLYRSPGYVILATSGVLYAGVAVWHFILHNQLRDPLPPHVLLAVSQLGLYIGTGFLVAGLMLPACRQKYLTGRASPA